ncbi:3-oxoacyl-[acyl-carrier-protein] synthase III C-terminal domain-containing protein [Priestia koreensis]|uniref:3-oxoacyl-[acyl-carrier-protein] synthase III C-terminal domain-containing protein n=1 Tax=Priestia koreensis TaxID=284581 RepID=UPI003D089475
MALNKFDKGAFTMIGIKAVETFRPSKIVSLEDLVGPAHMTEEEYLRIRDTHELRQIMDSENLTTFDMVRKAMEKLIEKENISSDDVETIIFSHAMQSHPSGLAVLEDFKDQFSLSDVPSITVSGMNCATTIMAFQLAQQKLMKSDKKYALLLFAEKMYTPLMRKIEDMTILSDAAAVCLVTKEAAENKIINISQFVDGSISNINNKDKEAFRWFQISYFLGIKKVLQQSLKALGRKKDEISMLVPHNVNVDTWDYVSRSLSIPLDRIYTKNIPKLGHANGCDLLINLEDVLKEKSLKKKDLYYLLSVGLGGTYGCIAIEK